MLAGNNNEIATDPKIDGPALDETVISRGDRGLVTQISRGEGEQKDDVQQSGEGEGLATKIVGVMRVEKRMTNQEVIDMMMN